MVKAKKWVVVGDHNQLRPVIKTAATSNGNPPADASLFAFLRNRHENEQWLEHHYRSHRDIIGFAKKHVYDNRIEIDDSFPEGYDSAPQGEYDSRGEAVAAGPPITFVDVDGEQQWRRQFSGSVNLDEVSAATAIVHALIETGSVPPDELGVITPYRGQRSLIADELTEHGEVEISTVDGFQGRERSIIVFSTVNTKRGGLEFAGNPNRFTVAATRPEQRFIILGNRSAIEANAPGGSLLRRYSEYAADQGGVFEWADGDWVAGIEPGQITVPPRDETTATRQSSTTSNSTSSRNTTSQKKSRSEPWNGTELDETDYRRVEDIVNRAPTTTSDLAEAWDLVDGPAAWEYLTLELNSYFEGSGGEIQPTDAAEELID
jgi:hypothetical protein